MFSECIAPHCNESHDFKDVVLVLAVGLGVGASAAMPSIARTMRTRAWCRGAVAPAARAGRREKTAEHLVMRAAAHIMSFLPDVCLSVCRV